MSAHIVPDWTLALHVVAVFVTVFCAVASGRAAGQWLGVRLFGPTSERIGR